MGHRNIHMFQRRTSSVRISRMSFLSTTNSTSHWNSTNSMSQRNMYVLYKCPLYGRHEWDIWVSRTLWVEYHELYKLPKYHSRMSHRNTTNCMRHRHVITPTSMINLNTTNSMSFEIWLTNESPKYNQMHESSTCHHFNFISWVIKIPRTLWVSKYHSRIRQWSTPKCMSHWHVITSVRNLHMGAMHSRLLKHIHLFWKRAL